MFLCSTAWVISRMLRVAIWLGSELAVAAAMLLRNENRESDLYTILWAAVFGFATLNIVNLAARRSEPSHRGLTFGELMAVLIVLLSIFLLGWELLGMLHIFPIKIQR